MILSQHHDPAILRREAVIQIFILLDDLADGQNFHYHRAVYEAIDQGVKLTAFASPNPTDIVDGRAGE